MGSGKSTVGRLLAQLLGTDFYDTDDLIAAAAQRSIPEIFAAEGEAAFRAMESDQARRLSQMSGLVIATGGGMLIDPKNIELLERSGHIFCLVASEAEILKRLSQEIDQRPLLNVVDPAQRLRGLLAERAPYYARFIQILTDDKNPAQIAAEIISQLPQN